MPRQTGLAMILTGELVPAGRLYKLGLISKVLPGPEVLPRAIAVATAIFGLDLTAVANAKLLHDMSALAPIDESLRFGRSFDEATLASAASTAGVAAFVGGRTPASLPPQD